MKKTFEYYLSLIENQIGISMLSWQEEALRMIYENKSDYYISRARGCGRTVFKKAAKLLEEFKKEIENGDNE